MRRYQQTLEPLVASFKIISEADLKTFTTFARKRLRSLLKIKNRFLRKVEGIARLVTFEFRRNNTIRTFNSFAICSKKLRRTTKLQMVNLNSFILNLPSWTNEPKITRKSSLSYPSVTIGLWSLSRNLRQMMKTSKLLEKLPTLTIS